MPCELYGVWSKINIVKVVFWRLLLVFFEDLRNIYACENLPLYSISLLI